MLSRMYSVLRVPIAATTSVRSYHEKVHDHYENPRNIGSLDKNDRTVGTKIVETPACDDIMKLHIRVDDNGNVIEAKWKPGSFSKNDSSSFAKKVKDDDIPTLSLTSHYTPVALLEIANYYSTQEPPDMTHAAEQLWLAAVFSLKKFFLHLDVNVVSSSALDMFCHFVSYTVDFNMAVELEEGWTTAKELRLSPGSTLFMSKRTFDEEMKDVEIFVRFFSSLDPNLIRCELEKMLANPLDDLRVQKKRGRILIDVSDITTALATHLLPMPICRYEVLDGSPTGQPVQFTIVGQQVYHKWTCDTETQDTFCMAMHTYFVDDDADEKVELLDENGCAKDKFLNNLFFVQPYY